MTNRQRRQQAAASPRRTRAATPASETKIDPQLVCSLPCIGLQQVPTGGHSLIQVFDTINRTGDQPVPITFYIINTWTDGFGHFTEHLTITDPKGNQVIETDESQFWLPNNMHRHNVQHRISVALQNEGPHTVRVFLDNQERLHYKIRLVVRPAPPSQGQP